MFLRVDTGYKYVILHCNIVIIFCWVSKNRFVIQLQGNCKFHLSVVNFLKKSQKICKFRQKVLGEITYFVKLSWENGEKILDSVKCCDMCAGSLINGYMIFIFKILRLFIFSNSWYLFSKYQEVNIYFQISQSKIILIFFQSKRCNSKFQLLLT